MFARFVYAFYWHMVDFVQYSVACLSALHVRHASCLQLLSANIIWIQLNVAETIHINNYISHTLIKYFFCFFWCKRIIFIFSVLNTLGQCIQIWTTVFWRRQHWQQCWRNWQSKFTIFMQLLLKCLEWENCLCIQIETERKIEMISQFLIIISRIWTFYFEIISDTLWW